MPDHRKHRGPHPEDARIFGPEVVSTLRSASSDLSWLLSRGYAPQSTLKLVGDRYRLTSRQRTAVARCTCSETDRARRRAHQISTEDLRGQPLWIDGYNVLLTIEVALSDGFVFAASDGTYRDMASMHGSYRRVAETQPAIEWIGRLIAETEVSEAVWFLDRPVSNSGRLKTMLREAAEASGWNWRIQLVGDPDSLLAQTENAISTADSAVLDRCCRWFNLARETVDRYLPEAKLFDFRP